MGLILNGTETAITNIASSWNKTVQSLLETAQLLVEYQTREDWFQIKTELAARSIMKSEVLSMMLSIGRNKVLNQANYLNQLPSSYNSLYHLSKMGDAELENKLELGEITMGSRLVDIRKMCEPKKEKVGKEPKAYTKTLQVSVKAYQDHKDEIEELMKYISNKYPFISVK